MAEDGLRQIQWENINALSVGKIDKQVSLLYLRPNLESTILDEKHTKMK